MEKKNYPSGQLSLFSSFEPQHSHDDLSLDKSNNNSPTGKVLVFTRSKRMIEVDNTLTKRILRLLDY